MYYVFLLIVKWQYFQFNEDRLSTSKFVFEKRFVILSPFCLYFVPLWP